MTLLSSCSPQAEVSPAALFCEHAVLQRGRDITIEAHSAPGARIRARWRGRTYCSTADGEGLFRLTFPSGDAGGPFTLKVGDKTIGDILVGDVFLCSGQSNAELPVQRCLDVVAEEIKGYSNPQIRYFAVPTRYSFGERKRELPEGEWEVLDGERTALKWSALCYFTARSLYEKTGVPVGMIRSAVGGSPIEAWMGEQILPRYALDSLAPLKDGDYLDSLKAAGPKVYSDWATAYSELPAVNEVWKDVDIFSGEWALDAKGEPYTGCHHLRRNLRLGAGEASGGALLHLGAMVDADSVFVNGTFVGSTSYRYPPRHYEIPEGVLREGDNLLEVHLYVYGHEGPGRFIGGKRYSLECSLRDIPLTDGWQHSYAGRMPARGREIFLQYQPSGLFNAMIAPLASYATAGVIWYQGESNAGCPDSYGELLEKMIEDWRAEMHEDSLPFYVVELADYEHSELAGEQNGWRRIRKAQRSTAEKMDGVRLIPNADLGEWNDIHPQDKKTLGERVADEIMKSID